MYSAGQLLEERGGSVWSIRAEAPVFQALELMAEKNCGALVVLGDDERLLGVVSERDYARKVALHRKTSIETPVSEIMTAEVVTANRSHTLDDCLALMSSHDIRHLPVVSGRRVIGVLGMGELVQKKVEQKEREVQALTKYVSGDLAYR